MIPKWLIVWIVTAQGVNFAFYLAATRVAYGWVRTLGAYFAAFVLPGVGVFLLVRPQMAIDVGCSVAQVPHPVGCVVFFAVWCAIAVFLSKGPLGRRLFVALVCGVHQIGVCSFSLILLCRMRPTALGGVLACGVLLVMGALLVYRVLPQVLRLGNTTGWRELNITAIMNFILLFVTGVWPTHVPTGNWVEIVCFGVANVVAVVYFPVALAFAGRHRAECLVRMLSDSTRVLLAELDVVRTSEESARRIRHDTRYHVEALRSLLRDKQTAAALHYLENTFTHELLLPPLNARWCENALVNALLTLNKSRAESKGLEFHAEARVPRVLKIGEPDLVALLGNLLENAVHGAAGGTVRVTVLEDRGVLRIGVANRVPAGFVLVNGLPCEHPGVGIQSVRVIVDKCRGLFDYELNDSVLVARVMIGGVA